MRIAIYTHSGPEIGMGHAVRCSHLARALIAAGAEVDIMSSPLEPGWPILSEIEGTLPWRAVHYVAAIQHIRAIAPDAVVLDLMIADPVMMNQLMDYPLVVIVGAGWSVTDEIKKMARLLVYQTGFLVAGVDISGPEYLVLAPCYALREKIERTRDVLVSFGGGIPFDYSVEVARACFALGLTGTLVFSRGYARQTVPDIGKFEIVWWPASLYPYQVSHGVYVGSLGMMVYESMATGCVPIVISRSSDHKETAGRLMRMGAVIDWGLYVSNNTAAYLAIEAAGLVADDVSREDMGYRGSMMIDGKGAQRVAHVITSLSI